MLHPGGCFGFATPVPLTWLGHVFDVVSAPGPVRRRSSYVSVARQGTVALATVVVVHFANRDTFLRAGRKRTWGSSMHVPTAVRCIPRETFVLVAVMPTIPPMWNASKKL